MNSLIIIATSLPWPRRARLSCQWGNKSALSADVGQTWVPAFPARNDAPFFSTPQASSVIWKLLQRPSDPYPPICLYIRVMPPRLQDVSLVFITSLALQHHLSETMLQSFIYRAASLCLCIAVYLMRFEFLRPVFKLILTLSPTCLLSKSTFEYYFPFILVSFAVHVEVFCGNQTTTLAMKRRNTHQRYKKLPGSLNGID